MAVHFGFSIWNWMGWNSGKPSEDSLQPESSPQTLEEKFTYYLLGIRTLSYDGDEAFKSKFQELMQMCTSAIASDLESFSFPLLQKECTTLETHLKLFDKITDKTFGLTEEERILLKIIFREACADSIKKKWIAKAVKQFYGILLLSDREGRILTTQTWAKHFLQGALYLGKLKSKDFFEAAYPKEFVELAKKAFEDHYNTTLKERIESTNLLLEWKPEIFWEKIETLQVKAKSDPSFLTSSDIEMLEDIPDPVSKKICYQMHSSILECKMKLLEACLFSTHTQQQLEPFQIGDSSHQEQFAKIFADLEAFEDKKIFHREFE